MSHFAKIKNGIVQEVIVAEQNFIDSLPSESGISWVQTSYNTHGGVHYAWKEVTVTEDDGTTSKTMQPYVDGGVALRKNFAGVGHIYDSVRDAFYQPNPYPSWTLNETSCYWEAPVPYPTSQSNPATPPEVGDKIYDWDETNKKWVEVT